MNLPVSLNEQPAEKFDWREDGSLDVVSVFSTIQGEGPLVGRPAVFVRLAGCNLDCPRCDTDYTSGRKRWSVSELIQKVLAARGRDEIRLVVLTGGEPLRQNLVPLSRVLVEQYCYTLQLETNGTLAGQDLSWFASVVCSPKTVKINAELQWFVTAYKYVVAAGCTDPDDGLPTTVLGTLCRVARPWWKHLPVYVQPEDDQTPIWNSANVREAVRVCKQFGYILSLQTHKILGLP